MFVKKTAVVDGLRPQILFASGFVSAAFVAIGHAEAVLTSALDSHDNRPASLHNKGLAADYRIRHLTYEQALEIVSFLKLKLDPLGFDTVLESDHIHVEYDPKPGENLFERTE